MAVGYYQRGASLSFIPKHITAPSAKALELQMLRLQTKLRSQVNWDFIQFNPNDKKWYAWYFIEVDERVTDIPRAVNAEE